jgi:hypothetical protein
MREKRKLYNTKRYILQGTESSLRRGSRKGQVIIIETE